MVKNRIAFPRSMAFILALAAIALFFLPFVGLDSEYIDKTISQYDELELSEYKVTKDDLKVGSLFTWSKLAYAFENEQNSESSEKYFVIAFFATPVVFAVFCLFNVLNKHPFLLIVNDALLGGSCYLVTRYANDRWLSSTQYAVGISYKLYGPLIAAIAFFALWMLIAKRRMKKEKKRLASE